MVFGFFAFVHLPFLVRLPFGPPSAFVGPTGRFMQLPWPRPGRSNRFSCNWHFANYSPNRCLKRELKVKWLKSIYLVGVSGTKVSYFMS